MGSKSSSNQSTTYNTSTNYTYNQLDGGAIDKAFDFANKQSSSAFGFGEHALDAVEANNREAFNFGEYVAGEAFDSVDNALTESLNHSSRQLDQMSALVKSTQTQGATELINANKETAKVMYITIGVVMVLMILMMLFAGRKR